MSLFGNVLLLFICAHVLWNIYESLLIHIHRHNCLSFYFELIIIIMIRFIHHFLRNVLNQELLRVVTNNTELYLWVALIKLK